MGILANKVPTCLFLSPDKPKIATNMVDPRLTKLATLLVDYSLKFNKGEKVAISADFEARPLVLELYKLLIKRGASEVKLHFGDYEFSEAYFANATKSQIETLPKTDLYEIQNMDCYIAISSPTNTRGLTGIDAVKISARQATLRPITNHRVDKTRWVICKYPTNAQAQEAGMSLSEYSDFVLSAVLDVDWKALGKQQLKLQKLVNKTNTVRIVGEETDLTMSIAGRHAVSADGEYNMPDGEVFTSVVENSTQGYITYTYPAIYLGREFHNVRLKFEKGRVVKAMSDKGQVDLTKILDTDPGARVIGELGLGNNYHISKFTKDILYDEKIGGSIHIALGRGYKETLSKNDSAIHWDMIKDLRRGGEIYFDGKLVQRNGKWLYK